jgi:hypothetical protein
MCSERSHGTVKMFEVQGFARVRSRLDEDLLGEQLLQSDILIFEDLQALGVGHVHAATLRLPVITVASLTPCLRAR